MTRPTLLPQPREAKLFRDDRSQAVRIPAEFALPGDRVRISRDGDRLILEPIGKRDLLDVLAALEPIEENFPDFDETLPPLDDDPL
ncbi:antitoxin [Methylobacterium aquaticum]|uniref:antitoxin n=1 Tax=Methylobacterium aquaticum TaxID=270351 RepID=UPI001932DB82|nr:AbrB/MazE/SpoVT family DNA-binding domain-containing protein [Methylobacterium aquaticum]QRE77474.1 AbrB/MazE/SpoVT family DNA-binding domain-containing protein [Methylobacterium aquaticum]